jgi:sialate O-acetylesterase
MLRRTFSLFLLSLFAATGFVAPASAEVKPGALFTSGVVLQREVEAPIWGTAAAGEKVEVTFAGKTLTAVPDDQGKWVVKLPPQKAGGPHKLTIGAAGSDAKIELADVYFGEVWIASGQSNMHWTFSHNIKDKEQTLSEANDPLLRQFTVKKGGTKEPAADVSGKWYGANREGLLAETTNGASAVGYFFGRELRKALDVPVGIINSSVGGTPIENWSPKGVLYNNMIHPLAPCAVRGAIWYQGESNLLGGAGMKYATMQKTMVEAWRKHFANDDMAFYFVQLAPYAYSARNNSPAKSYSMAEFWEAQYLAAKTTPHSGLVVINDVVHNVKDIHPIDKETVGKRLAALALAGDYGKKDVVTSGPTFKSAEPEGASLRVKFDNVHGGLVSRDGQALTHFLLAGEDQKFHPAVATIDGDTVSVRSAKVTKPVAVRFAWDEVAQPNLSNKAGWPAGSFRSDDWKLIDEKPAQSATPAKAEPTKK